MNDADICCISIGWLSLININRCYTLCILHQKYSVSLDVKNILIKSFVITAMMLRTDVQLCGLTHLVLGHVIIILNVLLSLSIYQIAFAKKIIFILSKELRLFHSSILIYFPYLIVYLCDLVRYFGTIRLILVNTRIWKKIFPVMLFVLC